MDNPITDIILKYAQEEDTDYALLITGQWGCGKTYYWKNILSKNIEKQNIVGSKKFYKPVYISLNGVSSIEQINNLLINALSKLGEISNYIMNFDVGGGTTQGVKNIFASLFKYGNQIFLMRDDKLKEIFICFDDLERISDKVNVDEIVGFINTQFIEHNHIKTIVLTDLSKGNLKKKKNKKILEKYFERTIIFKFNVENIVEDLSLNYKGSAKPYYKFLVKNKSYIIELLIDTKIENIRTIKFALRILKDVFNNAKEKELNKLSKEMILFTFSVSNEFKDGRVTSDEIDNPKIFTNIFQYTHKLQINELIESSTKSTDLPVNDDFVYFDQFYKKYINEKRSGDYQYFHSIYKYILTGLFESKLFKKDIENILDTESEWDEAYTKLHNFRGLSNKEFRLCYKDVLKFVEKGKYSLYRYINLSVLLKSFLDLNLLESNEDELLDIINRGLEIKDSSHSNEYNEDSFRHMNRYKDFTDKNIIQIRNKVISIHNQNKHHNLKNKVTKLFKGMKEGKSDLYKDYNKIAIEPIISNFSAEKLLKLITEAEPSLLVSIENFISYHGKNIKDGTFNDDDKKKEKIELELLLTRLKEYEETLNIKDLPVTKYNVKKIIKSIKSILNLNNQIGE